jgi:lysophospholipase L1-like esterase
MKLAIIVAALVVSSLPAAAQDFSYISRKLIYIENEIAAAPSPSVIIIGDSITEETGWPEKVCGATIINGGAGGSRTAYMLPLVVEFLRFQYHPAAIVIATGMNDAHKTLWRDWSERDQSYDATFRFTYRAIVQAALSATPNVLLATVSPVDFEAPVGSFIEPAGRDAVNKAIREIAADLHLTAIDTDALASIGPEPLTRDGVHFTVKGMHQFEERIVSAIRTKMNCAQ